MLENYRTIRQDGEHEIEIKKSRFICALARVDSEAAAKDFIAARKKEHWKASHNCSAFVLGAKQEIQRSSDDGEPSGTAGVPMLEALKKQELWNVVAVVTRYFGGTKLGAGGLIRAYSHAVSESLQEIGLVEGKKQQEIRLVIQYPQLGKMQHFLEQQAYHLKETLFTENITLICLVDVNETETFSTAVTEQLNGQVTIEMGPCSYQEIPLEKESNS